MKVKFKRLWRQYRPGDVADYGNETGLVQTLIDYGVAERFEDPPPDPEPAPPIADVPPENKGLKPHQVKRK